MITGSRNELRGLAHIPDAEARSLAVAERAARLGPEAFALAFDGLARSAALGSSDDTLALVACARWFVRERGRASARDSIAAFARRRGLVYAHAMLEDAPDHKALSWRGRLREQGGRSRIVRMGMLFEPPSDGEERRTSAGFAELEDFVVRVLGPTPAEIVESKIASWFGVEKNLMSPAEEEERAERLAAIGPTRRWRSLSRADILRQRAEMVRRATVPAALERLLREPDVTTHEKVAIAARRPTSAAMVEAICSARGWLELLAVRTALVENPFTPTAIALLLVPSCRLRLRSILRANVHARVHALARLCLAAPLA